MTILPAEVKKTEFWSKWRMPIFVIRTVRYSQVFLE